MRTMINFFILFTYLYLNIVSYYMQQKNYQIDQAKFCGRMQNRVKHEAKYIRHLNATAILVTFLQ